MMDKPEDIMRKFKRAVTDCDACVKFDKENKPGISNLLSIYCAATGKTVAEAEAAFAGQGYGIFKPAVAESVIELLRPIREEAERLTADKAYLESVYKDGLLSGKSGEFIITLVNGDESLIGTMHRVRVTKTHNWAVEGEIID